ncbi:MAG: protein arginine kinase [Phycisphaerales bacterium]|nr:MAG: protein arginine kinase [Phycisphaerales bacterium]
MNIDELAQRAGEWLSGTGPQSDIVISSRVRLARNVAGFPFLSRASESQRKELLRLLCNTISNTPIGSRVTFFEMETAHRLDRQVLVERHLISRQHAGGQGCRGVAVSEEETVSLMVNEEDHLRIQSLRSGLQLGAAWDEVGRLDDAIEAQLDYAYHPRLGYLTACPTNVGTGIRVSVMLHLPALKLADQMHKVFRATRDMHVAVRGLFGEGTEALGDFYQISNQTTLGKSEEEIISAFEGSVIPGIVKYEKRARELLVNERPALLDDKVFRAFGVLENARAMSTEETLALLSHLRMGVNLGRVSEININTINELFVQMQPAHLQKLKGEELTPEQRSVIRAETIRKRLSRDN